MVHGNFPLAPHTIVANPNAGSVEVVGLKRGVKYRVVSTLAANLQLNQAAAANVGMFLPANVPEYFIFGMGDSQGTNLKVYVYAAAAAFVYFTPVDTVAV